MQSFPFFFIGVSDAPWYGVTWSENGNIIDCFILEILTFKEMGKYDLSFFHTIAKVQMDTLFERQYLWNAAINHIAVFRTSDVILRGIRYANKKNCQALLLNISINW